MVAVIGVREYRQYAENRKELTAIDQVVATLEREVIAKQYAKTLPLFTDNFLDRKKLTPEKYEAIWNGLNNNELYGSIKSIASNGRVGLSSVGAAGTREAAKLLGKQGLDILRDLRAFGFERPVLVLTAQDAVDAKVTTLRAGADDYVTKPFAFEELLARVEALARRPRAIATPVLTVRDLTLDLDTREVRRGERLIDLTPKEFVVLEYLMRHAGRVMSRTLITEYAWGYHFDPGTNIVDVVINHLRKKVDANREHKLITTVRGVGYVVKG